MASTKWYIGFVSALLASGLSTAPVSAGSAADGTSERLPGALVLDALPGTPESADEALMQPDVDPPAGTAAQRLQPSEQLSAPAGGFTICHDGSVPAPVLADVMTALQAWSTTLDISGPTIAIDLGWIPLAGDGSLGVAGPTEFIIDPQLPMPATGYPIALANELLGTDLNGAGCGETHSEMALYLNAAAGGDGSLWNIGDDAASDDQVDLSTVVLHEVAHGLGIVSSAIFVDNGVAWPRANNPLYVYDRFFGECTTESAVGCDRELTANGTVTSDSLRGAQLWFDALGGQPLELHAPSSWSGGSSVSHLDEVRYSESSGLSLMTPYLRRGESFDAVDPALQSLVQTLGWTLSTPPPAPGNVIATPGSGSVDVAFQRPTLVAGAPATGYRVTVTNGSRTVSTLDTVAGPVTITGLTNGAVHQVAVQSLNSAGSSSAATPRTNRLIPLELPPFATAETAAIQLFDDLLGIEPTAAETAATTARLRSTSSLGSEAGTIAGDARLERRLQVVRLYLGFFEREPDPVGLQYWFDEVGSGVSLDVVASSFAIASEFEQGQVVPVAEFIDAAYQRLLDRAPDEAGRTYWQAQLGRGLDRGQMLILFSESAEHVAKTRVEANTIAVSFGLLSRPLSASERSEFAAVVARSGASGLAAQLAAGAQYDERHNPR